MVRSRPRRRRGVLLLVVMSVLVLFLVLTISYVLVASKANSLGKATAHIDKSGDPPNYLLDECAMLMFRGTSDPHCPFATWSLLEGIYGNVSFRGTISSSPQPPAIAAGGQFLTINTTATNTTSSPGSTANYFKGCVLTMLSGNCTGQSSRIVASQSGQITVMRFNADAGLLDPSVNDTFLVNGRAYCGLGRGFDPTITWTNSTPANDFQDPNGWQYALLPNTTTFQFNTANGYTYNDPAGPGGDNPCYTAYDYQNYYLGLVTHQNGSGIPPVLPSFHHADLYNYWATQVPGLATNATLLRKILFRPNAIDHPSFTMSVNPSFSPSPFSSGVTSAGSATVPLDVDNLGNGTADSIWIDPGFPVMVSRDGRTYKVLVAPLILDLDGRLNVNAHGSYTLIDPNVNYPNNGIATVSATAIAGGGTVAGGLPMGQCYGPADINLYGMLTKPEITNLLTGYTNGSTTYQGRYGNGYSPTSNRALTALRFFEYPMNDYRMSPLTSFGTPSDLKGRKAIALDYLGHPLFLTPNATAVNDSMTTDANTSWKNEVFDTVNATPVDTAYGLDLGTRVPMPGRTVPTGYNNPYTVGELERVLRYNDIDVRSLPPRLVAMLTSDASNSMSTWVGSDPWRAQSITNVSFDLPSPNLQMPRALRSSTNYRAFSIVDMLRAKLSASNTAWSTGTLSTAVDTEASRLLPPELIAGVRMDINQPFGNGRDDNGNGVVDEQGEAGSEAFPPTAAVDSMLSTIWSNSKPSTSAFPNSMPFYIPNGSRQPPQGTTPPGSYPATDPLLSSTTLSVAVQARQLMARHLYSLMMLFADTGYTTWTTETGLTAQQQQLLTARRVAQWAINAVSFRDSSSIMIPFMYPTDIYQSTYQGWTVDGDPNNATQSQTNGNFGLVWSCKPPDLVFTESLAFHDRRTADTVWDTGNKKKTTDTPPDTGGTSGKPNYDQTRVPQGSLFFELYCARNPSNPVAPGDLYLYTNNKWYLNLGAMDSATGASPVWRIVIGKSTKASGSPKYSAMNQVSGLAAAGITPHPDTTMFEPSGMNMFDNTLNIPIERVIWLGQNPPTGSYAALCTNAATGLFYANRNGKGSSLKLPILVAPDNYAVIGPRASTAIGATNSQTPWGVPSQQQINLVPTVTTFPTAPTAPTVPVSTPNGGQNSPNFADIKQPTTVLASADLPTTTWSDGTATPAQQAAGIGMNISEPLPYAANYYPQPTVKNASNNIYDAYGDLAQTDATKLFLDQPCDSDTTQNRPLLQDGIIATGTTPDYKTAFLQRLADPTMPFNAPNDTFNSAVTYDKTKQFNPYVTVDWLPIDLTVFNGEQAPSANDTDDPNGVTAKVSFASRQRGGSNLAALPNPKTYNIWAPPSNTDSLPASTNAYGGAGTANFQAQLVHTLGFLNPAYGTGVLNMPATPPGFTSATAPQSAYIGDPQSPFPWITWNARPYASLMELLLVPASAPERLYYEFSAPGATTPNVVSAFAPTVTDPYKIAAGVAGPADARAPFGHLLNFFATADTTNTAGQAFNFYRALEYMQVPSRFIGTETILNPNTFTASGSGGAATQFFLPPYNVVSNYRDPGRININTVTSSEVWNAFMSGAIGGNSANLTLQKWNDSRRGDGGTSGALIVPNSAVPTYFANPVRSAAAADAVPSISGTGLVQRGVDVTLLRSSKLSSSPSAPLFVNETGTAPADSTNSPRNAYFAYQNLERVSNLVTTRSNVFGVWLTIGYFEAFPNGTVDAGHPDGYQLGAELGSSTGDIERHRAFYIFDRSIPVGFERGQNHNVNRAILLKRYIE